MKCAVCDNNTNIVINTIVADISDVAPNNTYLIEIKDDMWCDIGYIWNGITFINPNPTLSEEII
jgi:hypothetical protein